jgi:D-alanine-D-alanine ligase-like ATP-grasp enzyme
MAEPQIPESIRMISTRILAQEALRRGIRVKHINDYQQANALLELKYKKHVEYFQGSKSSQTSLIADSVLRNKPLTKDFLRAKDIIPTEGKLFLCRDLAGICEYAAHIGYPIVVKKYDGTHGDLVFVGVKTFAQVESILKNDFRRKKYVLIEKEFKGKEYRFLATRRKVLAVTFREPANIIGDGKRSIGELIAEKNRDPQRGLNYSKPLITIEADSHVREKLAAQDLDLESVAARGKKIYLRNNSNLSTGGDSIDVTDRVHPELKRIAVRAVASVPALSYAGVDIMVKEDISRNPKRDGYAVLEMNSSPGIFMHHFPYEGKSRNVAGGILDLLFPETKG